LQADFLSCFVGLNCISINRLIISHDVNQAWPMILSDPNFNFNFNDVDLRAPKS